MLCEIHALCTLNKDIGNFLKRSHTNVLFKTRHLPVVNIWKVNIRYRNWDRLFVKRQSISPMLLSYKIVSVNFITWSLSFYQNIKGKIILKILIRFYLKPLIHSNLKVSLLTQFNFCFSLDFLEGELNVYRNF